MSKDVLELTNFLKDKYSRDYLKIEEVMTETGLGKGQVRLYLHKYKIRFDCYRCFGVAEFLLKRECAA